MIKYDKEKQVIIYPDNSWENDVLIVDEYE